MRSCDRLLQPHGTPMPQHAGIRQPVARAWSPNLPRFAFRDCGASPVPDGQLRHEREQRSTQSRRRDYMRQDSRRDDTAGPGGERPVRDCAGERAERTIGVAEKKLPDRPAFGFVRIEKARIGGAPRHQRQLPTEIPRVLDSSVHALAANRTMNVRRIAREEHSPFSVVSGLPMVEVEPREPGWIAEANATGGWGIHHRLQVRQPKIAGCRHRLILPLAIAAVASTRSAVGLGCHGDDAPGRRPANREEHRDAAATDKGVDGPGLQHVAANGPRGRQHVRFDVTEHEVLRVAPPFEPDARALPHNAVGAITACEKPCSNLLLTAIVVPDETTDVIDAGVEGCQFGAALDGQSRRLKMIGEGSPPFRFARRAE